MKLIRTFFYPVILLIITFSFFQSFFLQNKLPIPADTIIGLYHPFRDFYAKDYPNGIPYKNFLITDPVRQQFPWKLLAIEVEKKGQLPLWNPYNFAGTPLLANFQSAAFYPLNILFFVLPFNLGWSIFVIIQPVLAGIFLYLYLRNLNLSQASAFIGGFIFAFSGFSIAWLEWGNIVNTGLWLPLMLLSIDKLVSIRKNLLWYLILIFSLSSSFFAGHLQIFFYVFIISLGYFIARWLTSGRNKKILYIYLLLNTLFLILTAIQWLPTLQLINLSARNVDQLNWQQIEGWFIPWQHLIQFIVPDFFGNPTTLNYWGKWNYGEFAGYIGIIPLIFALFALVFRRDKKTLFFGLLFFLSLTFSLPTILAKLPYILQIPFLSTSQPTRLMFLTDFSLSILAALGIDWYVRKKEKKQIFISLIFVLLIFSGLWIFISQNSGENISVAKRNLYLPTILFIIASFIITINFFTKNKLSRIFFGALIIITIFDLFRFGWKFIPFTNSEYLFPSTKILSFLQSDKEQFRVMSTDDRILPPNFSIIYNIQSIDGYDPLYLRRYGELIAASERGKPDINPPFGFNRIITPHNINSPIIDLLGVKYVLSFTELPTPQFTKVLEEGQTKVYKNHQAFPRAFFVKNIKLVETKQQAIDALFDKNVNLQDTAIIENPALLKFDLGQGKAWITKYSENKVVIGTDNQKYGFLVLTDTFYPTWHVKVCAENEIQCTELAIHRTQFNFRGVTVPAGKHSVIFYNTLL